MRLISFLLYLHMVSSFIIPNVFRNWHCIGFIEDINNKKPYSSNIGNLPLVTWFDDNNKPYTTINICKHMGSKLDEGKIKNNCIVCPYHGLEINKTDVFGETMVYYNKLWWSYESKNKKPPFEPVFNNKKYESTNIVIDIDASLEDCAYNTMDLNHPSEVHNNIFGFGSNIPPSDIKLFNYDFNKLGVSFKYKTANNFLTFLKDDIKKSTNFHLFEYPYTTWSRVSLNKKDNLYVNVNFLPLTKNKTRWFITLKHNFWNKNFVKIAAEMILKQDKTQLNRLAENNLLKKRMTLIKKKFDNEEHLDILKKMYNNYLFPSQDAIIELLNYHNNNTGY